MIPYALAFCFLNQSEAVFEKIDSIDDARIRRVAFSRITPGLMAIASDNALYLSSDNGVTCRKATILKGEQVTHVHMEQTENAPVYLSGTRHCYKVTQDAERIFSASDGEQINFIYKKQDTIYIATSMGLYYAQDSLLNWKSIPSLKDHQVYSIESVSDRIYLVCDSGLYSLYPGGSLQRLFVTRSNTDESTFQLTYFKADSFDPDRFWLATTKGLFHSENQGETWQKFFTSGTGNAAATHLGQSHNSSNHLYLCSDAGFFSIDINNGKSESIFKGLPTTKIKWMDFNAADQIYLATDKGLYSYIDIDPPETRHVTLKDMMQGEPSIHELQEAALHYNSVHPEKVAQWRRRLKYRALLPRLSVDYDKTIGSSFSQSGHYYARGPDDWGVSLHWDMGNLIWNSYEDDVDNRSKLTTQLRIDILDEVNRLYYERLRLKHEIATAEPHVEETMLKELRLLELTSTLDGYTGGYYSEIRAISAQ